MPYIGQQPAPKVVTSSDLADDIVTADKIGDTAISGFSALGATPADTDEFLVSDAGTLKRMDYSYIKGGATHVKIATGDYSGDVTSITFTDCFTSTYDIYKVYFYNIGMEADNSHLKFELLDSGGSSLGNFFTTATNRYTPISGSGSNHESYNAADTYLEISDNDMYTTTTELSHLEMTIFSPYAAVHTSIMYTFNLRADNGYYYQVDGMSNLRNTTSARSIKFSNTSGVPFDSYKTVIYGISRA